MNRNALHTDNRLEQAIAQYAAHDRQLIRFCRKLTGTAWDAEDLAQTTWMKVWTSQLKRADQSITSSYLYRIAANAWTDYCRRRKALHQDRTEPIDVLEEKIGTDVPSVGSDWLQDAMERVVSLLPPRQRVILLLMDALRFTSAETAALLLMTEGAVKAALHRARTTLSQARDRGEHGRSVRRLQHGGKSAVHETDGGRRPADEAVVYAYLEAFRTRNVQGLLRLLNAEPASDVLPAVQGIHLAPVRGTSGSGAARAVHGAAAPLHGSLALAA